MTGTTSEVSFAEQQFLQNGAVSLFLEPNVLEAAITTMRAEGYVVNEVHCDSEETIFDGLGKAYDWKVLFGYHPPSGLDALSDGVTSGNGARRLLVFRGYDKFYLSNTRLGHAFIDVLESGARRNLLFGERLAVFVQVSDPRFRLDGLAAMSATWNPAEWLDQDRGL